MTDIITWRELRALINGLDESALDSPVFFSASNGVGGGGDSVPYRYVRYGIRQAVNLPGILDHTLLPHALVLV